MIWIFMVLVLGLAALVIGMALALLTDVSLAVGLTVGMGLFIVETLTFLVGVWLTAWMHGSRKPSRVAHRGKLLRHENHQLQRTLETQQLRIEALERDMAHLSAQPPARQTGAAPRVEARELQRATGEYRLVNTPSYTPQHSETEDMPPAGETGLYRPAGETGTHPIQRTGRVPRPRHLKDDDTSA